MQISGKILEIFEIQQINDSFKKREFILEYAENPQYPEVLKMECIQDKCSLLDAYNSGDQVDVEFNLKGRKWTDKTGKDVYFTSLQAWRISSHSMPEAPSDKTEVPEWNEEEPDNTLPF